MPRQLHGLVQHPTDHDQGRFNAVDEEVTWSADDRRTGLDLGAAQSQVPRSDTCAEFGPRDAARPVGLACHIAQGGHDQALVAKSSFLARLLMCPRKDAKHITLRGLRQPIAEHQPAVLARCAA